MRKASFFLLCQGVQRFGGSPVKALDENRGTTSGPSGKLTLARQVWAKTKDTNEVVKERSADTPNP